jgi:ornithine--oxo-acid transaminase
LEAALATRRYAALVLEPIQAEAGVVVPSAAYLQAAQALCRRHGTLFVVDEVQTGLYRTGTFLASQHFGLEPDMVVLAKALSGGLVPVGAVLMSDAVYESVYTSFKRAIVHTSTTARTVSRCAPAWRRSTCSRRRSWAPARSVSAPRCASGCVRDSRATR